MLQHKIRETFCASISRNPKGYQYLRTSDFVNSLRRRAASTYQRWKLTPGQRGNKRISSIRRLTIAKTGCG